MPFCVTAENWCTKWWVKNERSSQWDNLFFHKRQFLPNVNVHVCIEAACFFLMVSAVNDSGVWLNAETGVYEGYNAGRQQPTRGWLRTWTAHRCPPAGVLAAVKSHAFTLSHTQTFSKHIRPFALEAVWQRANGNQTLRPSVRIGP